MRLPVLWVVALTGGRKPQGELGGSRQGPDGCMMPAGIPRVHVKLVREMGD